MGKFLNPNVPFGTIVMSGQATLPLRLYAYPDYGK